MQSIKIIVNEFATKKGTSFIKAEVKGKFLPLATAEDDVYYRVSFVSKTVEMPKEKGVYEVSYNEGDMWIDNRPDFAEKHILRIKPYKCVYVKPLLPPVEKDVRAK